MNKYEYKKKLARVSNEQIVYRLLLVIEAFDIELREVNGVSTEDPEQKVARDYGRKLMTQTAIRDINNLVTTTKLDIGDDLLEVLRDMRDEVDLGRDPFEG